MRMIDLLVKDLKQFVRDWKAALFMVIMPIAFTVFFGLIFSSVGGGEDARLPVGFLDQDGGALGAHLVDLLEASDIVRPVILEDELLHRVEKMVEGQDLAAAVVFPAGYSEAVLAGEAMTITVIVNTDTSAGATAQSSIQVAVTRLQGALEIARLSAMAVEAQGGTAGETFLLGALSQAVQAWQEPPLAVESTQSGVLAEAESAGEEDMAAQVFSSNPYAHSSPGMIVQFSLAGLMSASTVLVLERKSYCLRRLLTTAVSRLQIIVGHFLAMFTLILLQVLLLMVFSQVFLGLDYLRQPLATLLLAVGISLWTAALGLFIGVVARSEDQSIMFAMIPMLVFSGLGGAWVPLEFTGETFQAVGHLLPTAWAMDGLKDILIRGLGLEAVLAAGGVMLAYAVAFFVLSIWRFKFE